MPNAVGGQQDPAFEDEVCGMRGAGEPIQERFEGVSSQVLLRRCAGPALRGSRTSEDWIRRDTVSPELTPASPMFVRPGTSPAVGGQPLSQRVTRQFVTDFVAEPECIGDRALG
ncbi:Uncharacterised protein [Mycobacterium tuberculosis]|uniref:Uncharacterized protein n=1 Tax=Mycobacterium tuberculosis TaxID=1773 RepID=A0A916L8K8_MYCTX|nr:Uncharacterised protein [Mycobacterium tuberculosis]